MKPTTLLAALLLPLSSSHAASVVFLADSATADPSPQVGLTTGFQPFANTISGQVGTSTIGNGTTALEDALTFSSLPAGGNGGQDNGRFEAAVTNPAVSVTYGFATVRDLDGILFWNYNEVFDGVLYNERGITRADITITYNNGASTITLEDMAFTLTPEANGESQGTIAQQIAFGSAFEDVTAINLSDFVGGSGGNRTGWAEFAAYGVPEPSSTALFGCALFGMALRRRR